MTEFSFKTSKGAILDSMLNRPDTAKLIKDALASPIGSTSRVKARKFFSIMNKLNDHNNRLDNYAEGNVYPQMGPQEYNQTPSANKVSKSMVIFNKIPKANINYGQFIPKNDTQRLTDMIKHNSLPKANNYVSSPGAGMGGPGYDESNSSFRVPGVNYSPNAYGINSTGEGNNYNTSGGVGYGLIPPSSDDSNNGLWGLSSNNNNSYNNLPGLNSYYSNANESTFSANNATGTKEAYKVTPTSFNQLNQKPAIFDALYPKNTSNKDNEEKSNWVNPKITDVSNNNWWNPSVTNDVADFSNQSDNDNYSKQKVSQSPATSNEWWNPSITNDVADFSNQSSNTSSEQKVSQTPDVFNTKNSNNFNSASSDSTTLPVATFTMGTSNNRMDRNNNPTAFTTDIAKQAGLVEGVDYVDTGDTFDNNGDGILDGTTAKLLGNPIDTTIKVINNIGFKTKSGQNRWTYTDSIPGANNQDWNKLNQEQKTAVIAQMYKHEGGGGSGLSNVVSEAQKYVDANTGPTKYGMDMANKKMGGSLQQVIDENRKKIFEEFNIKEQNDAILKLKEEGLTLPKDITDYIKGRDTFLKQTDAEIRGYLGNVMAHTDMSNPANAAEANAHLNYLYTLRGRQNNSYIGYLNDSIKQHNNILQTKVDKYKSDLSFANSRLKTMDTISATEYDNLAKSYGDMYTELKNAPTDAMKTEALAIELGNARKKAAEDAIDHKNALDLLSQQKKLHAMFYDNDGHFMINTDLAQKIQEIRKDPQNTDITEQGIVQAYVTAVDQYMNAVPSKSNGITADSKMKLAKKAVKEFEKLSIISSSIDSDGEKNQRSLAYLQQANLYKAQVKSSISTQILKSNKIPEIKKVIHGSVGDGWFGWIKDRFGTSLEPEQEFVDKMDKQTNHIIDKDMAKSIYAAISFATDNGKNKEGKNAFLYPSSDIANAGNNTPYDFNHPFSDTQFANNLADIIMKAPDIEQSF